MECLKSLKNAITFFCSKLFIIEPFFNNKYPFPPTNYIQNTLSTDLKEDYSDLPPTQRLKKLSIKIQELTQKIGQETAARDGLMKMKGVYEANSLLGDPMTVEGQLNESNHKLEKLKVELLKFQNYLEQAHSVQAAQQSPQSNRSVPNGQRNSR